MAIAKSNGLQTAEVYYHAAQIMNHGDTIDDARHTRWLSAASYDRWQMYQGKPQKHGTNYIYDGRKDRLWDVDPETTDEERAAWDVTPLAKQLRKAEAANRYKVPLSDEEQKEFESNAPDWLKAILKHWREEQNNLE